MKSLGLFLVLAVGACAPVSPLRRTPESIAGLPLEREITGTAALAAVNRLHEKGGLAMDSAWIAIYGTAGPSAVLYVAIASGPAGATKLVENMDASIRKGPTPFHPVARGTAAGRAIQAFEGGGQLHYVFADGPRAVWLSADRTVARRALADALGLAAENDDVRALTPQGRARPAEVGTVRGLGPLVRRLVDVGAIDSARFEAQLARSGHPLSQRQRDVLAGRDLALRLDAANAAFLLNTLWPLALVNRNPVLTTGPMAIAGETTIMMFASTGGWKLGRVPVNDLYASMRLVALSPEEQKRLERVARAVYRPCCDNPTYFPDCNHGMAMLGLMTLLTARGADEGVLFQAARAANAVWFPQQSRHVGAVLAATGSDDPRLAVGPGLFSATGHRALMQRLADQFPGSSDGTGLAC